MGVQYEERPTVTYMPLQGDEFVNRLLTPLRMETIILLRHSGWRMDRLRRCCVQRMNDLTGGRFEIQASLEQPRDAFVKVHYRDAWFYIDDSDLTSKSTFTLIGQLFELQAGHAGGVAPILTLPIGD